MKKRVLSIILCLCLILPLFPTVALAEESLQGEGTRENPYQIGTAAELKQFRDLVNDNDDGGTGSNYRDISAELTADIDLNPGFTFHDDGTVNTAPYPGAVPENWEPIGKQFFSGSFDGKGFTISGLYIKETEQTVDCRSYGLFGTIGSQNTNRDQFASLKNLTVEGTVLMAVESGDAYDTTSGVGHYVSIIAGEADGNSEILRCTAKGVISVNKYSAM